MEDSGQLDFLGLVGIAFRLVQDEYPDAELYEGDGESPFDRPRNHLVTQPGLVDKLIPP
jgi:hypothetical protein